MARSWVITELASMCTSGRLDSSEGVNTVKVGELVLASLLVKAH